MFFIRMFIKLLCIIVHRIFLFGSFQFFILWFHWPWWKRTWTHHIRIINSRHLHPWDFSGNWLLTVDSLFCNSKMRKTELVSMQKKKSGHTYLRVCRPEAFKAINNSVLLYLTLSLVKKKKKKPYRLRTLETNTSGTQPEFEFTFANFFFHNFSYWGWDFTHLMICDTCHVIDGEDNTCVVNNTCHMV